MNFSDSVYFISEHANQDLFHGGIGPVDIEKLLLNNKAIPIRFPYHFDFSIKAKIARIRYLLRITHTIKAGAVIVFQHPVYARMNKLLLLMLRLRKTIMIVCFVADIDGLKDGNNKLLQKEISFFRRYSYFILHNPNMKTWLHSFHPPAKCSLLQCFDFLAPAGRYERSKSNYIVFAGNLNKSLFLEKLHTWLEVNQSLHINLYGPYVTDSMLVSRKVTYKGMHHPYALPALLEGSFGLIWDGDGIEMPTGSLGHYMHYISHHKLSLYIVSHLPVIVHENAGSAELVRIYNIGFTVSSLFEIEDRIKKLAEKDYEEMLHNTYELAKKINSGHCFQNALTELIKLNRKIKGD